MASPKLDEHQLTAVNAPHGPLAIMAGPGSGKTATLVARISHLCRTGQLDPKRAWALCHTTKAAGELRDRLGRAGVSGVTCSTVHSAAWRQVRRWWGDSGRAGEPKLVASTYPLVRRAAKSELSDVDTAMVADLASELEWAVSQRLTPASYAPASKRSGRTPPVPAATFARIWAAYIAVKERDRVVDFGDVLAIAADMLTHPDVGPDVQSRLDAVFVDEYQDIDPAQQHLIDGWLGAGGVLCAVGDEDQAVFQFKGGDPAFLTGFAAANPGATVVHLTRNWRSTPEIVEWVNRLATPGRPPLEGMAAPGPEPRLLTPYDEAAEERALTNQLTSWHRSGTPWSEMAVLFRFNATAARLEAALGEAGIPYHVAGQTKFFDRPEIRAVLVPFGKAARAEPDADGLDLLADAAAETGFDPTRPPEGAGAARQRWEAISALIGLVSEQCAGLAARYLLTELQQRATSSHDVTPGGVALATIHAAKGLEWDAVWVVGAVEGQMPSVFATTKAQLLEERRLFYVAASRARRYLVVSAAKRRHNNWTSQPSRFLELLKAAPRIATTTASPARAPLPSGRTPGECERCGSRLTSAHARRLGRCSAACLPVSSPEAAAHARLVEWRAERGAALGVDPTELVTDRALFQIAATGSAVGVRGVADAAHPVPIS